MNNPLEPVRAALTAALLSLSCTVQAAPPTAAQVERLERDMPGYTAFDPGYAQLLADPLAPVGMVYHLAQEVIRGYRGCLQMGEARAPEAAAAHERLVTTQLKHVSAAQWRALEAALADYRLSVGADLACMDFLYGGTDTFDVRVDGMLQVRREMAQVRNAPEDTRSDVELPVLGVELAGGAEIGRIPPGGEAERAGLRIGDTIKSVNGTPVASMYGIAAVLRDLKPGDTVRLDVQRLNLEARSVETLQLETTLESVAVVGQRIGQDRRR